MRPGRMLSLLLGSALTLAACGASSTTEPAAEPAAAGTVTPSDAADDRPTPATDTASDDATVTRTPDTTAPATTSSAREAPASDTTTTVDPSDPPTPTTADLVPTGVDDGCTTGELDTDVAEGPVPALDVRAESADNGLPDLAVRRINCAGGWVNLKNELPADRPVLVWFWAPH